MCSQHIVKLYEHPLQKADSSQSEEKKPKRSAWGTAVDEKILRVRFPVLFPNLLVTRSGQGIITVLV